MNNQILASQVRLVDENGEMIGVVTRAHALERAKLSSLDLVEVSPNADPPVCKILDYGKLRYEAQKKQAELKKRQKVIEVKEIQIRPGIEEHDYQVKLRNSHRFLTDGDKVKVTLQFRGRELSRKELGIRVLERIEADLNDIAKVESPPKLEGKRMMMVFIPRTGTEKEKV
ncbi:MAG: translation initiation factor IF-3 [Holosporales bacterium]|nr:translation initiation factor IF-3 [Holosporales bacterium]